MPQAAPLSLASDFATTDSGDFIDRRSHDAPALARKHERRQFGSTHDRLSPDARELAEAIDEYKLRHRRRFITFEEMLAVFKSLGYRR